MRRAALPVLALACCALAGCGGRPAQEPEEVLPVSTSVLLHVDRGSELAAAERLLGRVSPLPGRLRAALAAVRLPPGAGPVFVARVPAGWVALLRPSDPKAYARRLGPRPAARVRGWTVVAASRAALDEVRHAHARLTARAAFRPPATDALATAWAAPRAAAALGFTAVRDRRWAEATLSAGELVERQRAASLGPSAPSAPARAADGAAFALGGGPWTPLALVLPALGSAYGVDAGELGRDLPAGSAVVVRSGDLIPEVTVVGEAADAPAAARRLGTLLVRGATFSQPATVDGVELQEWVLGAGQAAAGAWGTTFAAGTGTAGVVAARRGRADLGLPERTQGWVFVDAAAARPVAAAYDAFAGGGEAEAQLARLGPIRRLVAWATDERGVETTTFAVQGP
jgi:hypothetical protein